MIIMEIALGVLIGKILYSVLCGIINGIQEVLK